ncbi:hypothetical protein HII36_50365 [Nonomuraea sp. NN258]|uniref:hypothetical protein n=1 Tax=Nonomuraea antri TaxID=2730852 RepID=UPI001568D258|nr:hypothetical protein [Nonomuraea antri]NRQ39979.1 hypothetical protein [Nonomuraea antri]
MADFFDDSSFRLPAKDLLPRTEGQELPVVLLLGPEGTDKSEYLRLVWESVVDPESPRVRMDFRLTGQSSLPVVKTVERIAHDLMESSTVKLPRVVFCLHVLELKPAGRTDAELAEELDDLVSGKRKAASDSLHTLRELLGGVPEIGPWLAGAVAVTQAALAGGRYVSRLLNDKGRSWLQAEISTHNVVDLARRRDGQIGAQAESAALILCKALLADLTEAWSRRTRYPRCCLLLLEGAETDAGRAFLKALVPAKGADPLLVVAASRMWLPVGASWARPGTVAADDLQVPRLDQASHADWRGRGGRREHRWWYPVLMPPATPGEPPAGPPAIYRLTGGHPAATRRLLELLGPAARDDDLRSMIHQADVLRWPGLHLPHLDQLCGWAAAAHLDDAENALLDLSGGAPNLRDALGDRLWLTTRPARQDMRGRWPPQDGEQVTVLHPWLRRLLLHRLAHAENGTRWDVVHKRLEEFCLERYADESAALHHRLARVTPGDPAGHLLHVARGLDRQFGLLDQVKDGTSRLAEWIGRYDHVTTAPNALPLDRSADDLYDSLMATGPPPPGDERILLIKALIVNRWFWLDPLLDPSGRRASQIAHWLRELALLSGSSPSILLREAERYEQS